MLAGSVHEGGGLLVETAGRPWRSVAKTDGGGLMVEAAGG